MYRERDEDRHCGNRITDESKTNVYFISHSNLFLQFTTAWVTTAWLTTTWLFRRINT